MSVHIYWGSETGTAEFFGSELSTELKAAGLKVGGTKHERIARLVYAIEYKIYERPRADFYTRSMVAAFASQLDDLVSRHST